MTEVQQKNGGWSVERFAQFWARPDPALAGRALAPDAVGYWPRFSQPVRGREAYIQVMASVIAAIPDLKLEVAEHATNGEFVFIRWIGRGTYEGRPFETTGIDRVRVRDGVVLENYICSDHPLFEKIAEQQGFARSRSASGSGRSLIPTQIERSLREVHAPRPCWAGPDQTGPPVIPVRSRSGRQGRVHRRT